MAWADWSISFNGFQIGGSDPLVDFILVEGVEDLPEVEGSDLPRAGTHGMIPGPHFARERRIIVTADIACEPEPEFRAVVDAMKAATVLRQDELPLSWKFGSAAEKMANVRCRRRSLPVDLAFALNVATVTLEFVASDPRIFAAGPGSERSGATGPGEISDGVGFPLGFPLGFGDVESNSFATVNEGSVPAPWEGVLIGPLSSPMIELASTGERLSWDGLEIPAGQRLVLSSRTRTARLGGTASRYPAPHRDWFEIPPGTDAVQFSASAGNGMLQMWWRDTFL